MDIQRIHSGNKIKCKNLVATITVLLNTHTSISSVKTKTANIVFLSVLYTSGMQVNKVLGDSELLKNARAICLVNSLLNSVLNSSWGRRKSI